VDPLAGGTGDAEVAALVFDTLYHIDSTGHPVPHLASALIVEPAAPLRARLRLREGVRTHDGRTLKAQVVAASLERALKEPGGWMLAPIRAARAAGDDLLELELYRPAPDLPLILTTPAAAIASGRRVGTGPFRMDGLDDSGVRLTAHLYHFAGRPYLDSLAFRTFASRTEEAGTYQVGALAVARHTGAPPGSVTAEGTMTLTEYLAFGRLLPDDLAHLLRAIFDRAIQRERLRRLAVRDRSQAACGAPPALGGTGVVTAYDAQAAQALANKLAQRSFTLVVDRTRLDDRSVADRILADLTSLGVTLKLEPLAASAYQDRLQSGQYELLLGLSAPPAPDGGLAELALLAAVDPASARAHLAKAPAAPGIVTFSQARVLPLFHRAPRLIHVAALHGLTLDFAGRASWADAYWRK
jgi:MarR-like DNA-binding transcriptional regulator SgrR of sgrS sRNA